MNSNQTGCFPGRLCRTISAYELFFFSRSGRLVDNVNKSDAASKKTTTTNLLFNPFQWHRFCLSPFHTLPRGLSPIRPPGCYIRTVDCCSDQVSVRFSFFFKLSVGLLSYATEKNRKGTKKATVALTRKPHTNTLEIIDFFPCFANTSPD